jgi:Domain of unknown function (DUF4430)
MRRAVLVLLVAALPGCGLGEGEARQGGAELRVTRDFGHERLGATRLDRVREDQTVMRLLRSRFRVDTRYGGRFVQAVDGLRGQGASGSVDWFYFVNGVEADVGAAEYELSPGDVVQWDRRRWDGAMRAPAIVGAFPEPLRHGLEGKRLPVRVECEDPESTACTTVKDRLRRLGVRATGASLNATGGTELIRVIVARWRRAREHGTVKLLEKGPERSGVFARFSGEGDALELLGEDGRRTRRAASGTGLVAALASGEREFVWLVSGLDGPGVEAAARALDRRSLMDAYAVAAGPRGVEKLPLEKGRG